MSEQKLNRIEELYNLVAKSAQSDQPRRGLLGWKCPKCNGKMAKESLKETIFGGEGGSDFAKRVVKEAGLAPGLYEFAINHFTCKCGYEFVTAAVEPMREDI